jgi:hypothetical protein
LQLFRSEIIANDVGNRAHGFVASHFPRMRVDVTCRYCVGHVEVGVQS